MSQYKFRRLTTQTPDLYALESIIPEYLKNNEDFLEFIEIYLEWLQEEANSPGSVLNSLLQMRDIDSIEEAFIQYLQREFATSIPNIKNVDKRKLYKQVNDIYRSKGSTPSYEALFNLLFGEKIELYFPRVDILKPSEGKWDPVGQRYLNNDGFLSDHKYIQDSYYYQDFSYVIKTGSTIELWRDVVKKLLHPSGFAFFGEINIVSQSTQSRLKAPLSQPGTAAGTPQAYNITAPVVSFGSASRRSVVIKSTNRVSFAMNKFGASTKNLDRIKFTMLDPIDNYKDMQIQTAYYGIPTNSQPDAIVIVS